MQTLRCPCGCAIEDVPEVGDVVVENGQRFWVKRLVVEVDESGHLRATWRLSDEPIRYRVPQPIA